MHLHIPLLSLPCCLLTSPCVKNLPASLLTTAYLAHCCCVCRCQVMLPAKTHYVMTLQVAAQEAPSQTGGSVSGMLGKREDRSDEGAKSNTGKKRPRSAEEKEAKKQKRAASKLREAQQGEAHFVAMCHILMFEPNTVPQHIRPIAACWFQQSVM